MIGAFNQLNSGESRNSGYDVDFAFRRQGKPTIPQLTVEVEYSDNRNTNEMNLSGLVTQADPSTPKSIPTERDLTKGKYPYLNAKVDYSYPFSPKAKLELGGKYQDRSTVNDFTAAYQNAGTGVYEPQPVRSNSFSYREHIGGAYGLFSRSLGKFQTQAGTRVELAQTMFDLPLTSQHFDKHYASLYPSAVVTYSLTDMRTVRTSYSRRVSRPNPFQLSPIEFRQDSRNVFRGNPDLGAEYTNAFDVSFTDAHTWGSVQLNPYFRYTNSAVRNIQYIDANGISVSTFANLAHNQQVGADLNVNIRRGAFQGAVGGSASHYSSDAANLTLTQVNLSTKVLQWSTRGNGTWKFNNKWDAQAFTFYRPATKTEGGSSLASINTSAGVRYKAWGDQGNIALRVNDPFKLQKFGYRTANGSVVEYSERFFGARALFLTISRNFGQAQRLRPKSDSEGNPTGPPSP
jgi:outer membrane receptor protein involved in Fe transport